MARRVVGLLRHAGGGPWGRASALEATAYALAEDLDVALVLRGEAVEIAVAGGQVHGGSLGGVTLPAAAAPQDLRGLAESGMEVYAFAADLHALGLDPADLVAGVDVVDDAGFAQLVHAADAVVTW